MSDDLVSPLIKFFKNKNILSVLLSNSDDFETTKEKSTNHLFYHQVVLMIKRMIKLKTFLNSYHLDTRECPARCVSINSK